MGNELLCNILREPRPRIANSCLVSVSGDHRARSQQFSPIHGFSYFYYPHVFFRKPTEESHARKVRQLGNSLRGLFGSDGTVDLLLGTQGLLNNGVRGLNGIVTDSMANLRSTMGGLNGIIGNSLKNVGRLGDSTFGGLEGTLGSVNRLSSGTLGGVNSLSSRLLGRSAEVEDKSKDAPNKAPPKDAKKAEKVKQKEEQKAA